MASSDIHIGSEIRIKRNKKKYISAYTKCKRQLPDISFSCTNQSAILVN